MSLKRWKCRFPHAWDLERMRLKCETVIFLIWWDLVRMSSKRETWRYLTREMLWEWAQKTRKYVFLRLRSCENTLKTRKCALSHGWDFMSMSWKHIKIAISHVWDRVRMSSKRQKIRFLKREILWEWALTRNKPVFSQCYPPRFGNILLWIFKKIFYGLGS